MTELNLTDLVGVLRRLPRLVTPEIEEALRAAGLEVRKRDAAATGGRIPPKMAIATEVIRE